MKKLSIGSAVYEVPQSFEECSQDQISNIMVAQNVISNLKEAGLTERANLTKLSILFCLAPIEKKIWKKLKVWQKLSVLNLVRWAWTTKIESRPFEFFTHKGIKYLLPADDYADTTSLEWALTNIYYMNYSKNQAFKNLFFLLIATICRPEREDLKEFRTNLKLWNGDSREAFNNTIAEERAKEFESVAFGVLIAVFQYWEAMNNRFIQRNEILFEGDGDETPLFHNGEGCLSLLEDIAEESVLGDLERVHETNVTSLFMYLRHKQKKMERREKETQKLNDND